MLTREAARDRFMERLFAVPIGEGSVETYGEVDAVLTVYSNIWEPAGAWL